ncbi:hypothetical protein AB833_23490 [Chromatiales bacterium (ex Bugula neritina AB1)]|nr:hypothetical protein AB833_23490 [Chromatiales bacterium (ex Bugula neritina AB1)]
MWSIIESHRPDLFLWAGDVIYADTEDPEEMKRKYQEQLSKPAYQQFLNSVPVAGIWDDHDFGNNDSGKNNPIKKQSQQLFLDFLGEPADSVRRQREGIYTSRTYGSGERQVRLILLDTRYHRDLPGSGRADVLGKQQWQWLEQQFATGEPVINFIVSGFSVLSDQLPYAEEWQDFKWARKKLFRLIEKYKVPGVIFLTGDRHFSAHLAESERGRIYHEFMSSGLTHYMRRKWVSRVFRYYYGVEFSYFGRNFSMLDINWDNTPVQLTFSVYDDSNIKQVEKNLYLHGRYWTDQ